MACNLIIELGEALTPVSGKICLDMKELFGPSSFCHTGSPLEAEKSSRKQSDLETAAGHREIRAYREISPCDVKIFSNFLTVKTVMLPLIDPWCTVPKLKTDEYVSAALMLKSNIKYLVVFKIRYDFIEAEQAPLFCLAWYLSYTCVTRQKREHSKWSANIFQVKFSTS